MLNCIKMDLYRMFRMKSFYMIWIILAAATIFTTSMSVIDYNMLEEEEGPSNAFVEQVNRNVIEWLYGHIKTFDRSVAEYKYMNSNSERL